MKIFAKAFLATFLAGAVSYAVYEISVLTDRIQKIENRFGGSEKAAWSENINGSKSLLGYMYCLAGTV